MNLEELFYTNSDSGKATFESKDKPIISLLEYIENQLPVFISENKKSIKNEKGLAQNLRRILLINLNDSYPFTFDPEGMQDVKNGNSPTIDLEVLAKKQIIIQFREFKKKEVFFAFEVKTLVPKEKFRYQEYVIGKDSKYQPKPCGGIERFKRNIHSSLLNNVGMFGFIIRESIEFWYSEINRWIEDLINTSTNDNLKWSENDKLCPLDKPLPLDCKLFTSINSRIGNNPDIFIYHFFINLC